MVACVPEPLGAQRKLHLSLILAFVNLLTSRVDSI